MSPAAKTTARSLVASIATLLCACAPTTAPNGAAHPTGAEALAFLDEVEQQYTTLGEEAARVGWVNATYINFDTDWLVANVDARTTELRVKYAKKAVMFDDVEVPADARRKLELLKRALRLPAPSRDGAARELAEITTRLESAYGTGKIEYEGRTVPQSETENLMRTLRDPAKLEEVWTKWHDYAQRMKDDYARMVEIANEGARELGYADVGALWRSDYDMPPTAFAAEVDRLWSQVKPLYDDLHCYVRRKLNERYGDDAVPLDKPIRADLLGNMWAQSWASLYDLVAPPGADAGIDLDKLLVEKGYDPDQNDEDGRGFLLLARVRTVARHILGALADRAARGPRGRVPCFRLGSRQQGRRAHQDVHGGQRRGLPHDPPRARPQLLPARLRESARAIPRRRQRRLPRGDRRHDHAVDHAGVSAADRAHRPRARCFEGPGAPDAAGARRASRSCRSGS